MREVFIFGDNKTPKAIVNVGEEAVVAGRDLFEGDWTEEQIRQWFEMNPCDSVILASKVLEEAKGKGVAFQLDDDEDFQYDDALFQNLNGVAYSYGSPKETVDFICQVHRDVFRKGLEPAIEKFFADKK